MEPKKGAVARALTLKQAHSNKAVSRPRAQGGAPSEERSRLGIPWQRFDIRLYSKKFNKSRRAALLGFVSSFVPFRKSASGARGVINTVSRCAGVALLGTTGLAQA